MVKWLLLAVLAFPAHADLITELGGGVKWGASFAVTPQCSRLLIPNRKVTENGYDYYEGWMRSVPCGGDNPVFFGWPIAWDFPNGMRIGWAHYSNWFDGGEAVWFGGDVNESNFNCLCVSKKINWTKRHKARKGRKK